MARKQLLVMGFRNAGLVVKHLRQQKAARVVGLRKLHTGEWLRGTG